MPTIVRGSFLCLALLSAGVYLAFSQTTQQQSPQAATTAPVIRTTTRLVQLSVVVTDKKGQPVAGLKSDDFTVLDGKVAQKIAVFSGPEMVTASQPIRTLPLNIFTNRRDKLGEKPGSNTIIFFDALNTSLQDQMFAREQVMKFLSTMQPEDHFAIYALTGPLHVQILHEFTQDDAALRKAMKDYKIRPPDESIMPFAGPVDATGFPGRLLALSPQGPTGTPQGQEDREQMVEEYSRLQVYPEVGALIGIANHVALIPGRKNLIWISGAVPLSVSEQYLPEKVRLSDLGYRLGEPVYAEKQVDLFRAVTQSCNAANVVMYGIDVHGVQTGVGLSSGMSAANRTAPMGASIQTNLAAMASLNAEQSRRDTFRMMADETGGAAFFGNNDLTEGMAKAFDDGRYAYTIGYYPDHGTWDGSFRKIQIKVDDPGAHARYRDGYYATADKARTAADNEKQLQDAGNSPLDSNALSMMVSVRHVKPQPVTGPELDFQIGVDVAQLLLEHSGGHWKGSVDLVFLQRDETGQALAAEKKRIDLDFSDAQYQAMLSSGAIFERHLTINAGAKDVRAILRDATSGQVGSVTVPLKSFLPDSAGTASGQAK